MNNAKLLREMLDRTRTMQSRKPVRIEGDIGELRATQIVELTKTGQLLTFRRSTIESILKELEAKQ